MWAVRAVLLVLLILVIVAFAFNNFSPEQTVDVNFQPFYNNYVGVPLVTVVFWSLAAGAILSLLLFITVYIKLSVQVHTSRKRVKALEEEVSILRNRPIEESAELLRGDDTQGDQTESAFKDE